MRRGHVPVRQCIGCRARRPQPEMVRLGIGDGNEVAISSGSVGREGRGCYVCPVGACVNAALAKGRLAKALRRESVIPPLKEEILRGLDKKG
ncbi:MAG: DUF448 domain-containing protein [Pseudomonadota bacterium]